VHGASGYRNCGCRYEMRRTRRRVLALVFGRRARHELAARCQLPAAETSRRSRCEPARSPWRCAPLRIVPPGTAAAALAAGNPCEQTRRARGTLRIAPALRRPSGLSKKSQIVDEKERPIAHRVCSSVVDTTPSRHTRYTAPEHLAPFTVARGASKGQGDGLWCRCPVAIGDIRSYASLTSMRMGASATRNRGHG
jgi:hypothetical protein